MKNNIIFFVLGSAIGSAVTFFVTKKVYEKKCIDKINLEVDNRVNAEIAALKKDYSKEQEETEEDSPQILVDPSNPTKKPDLMEYHKMIFENHKHTPYSDVELADKEGPIAEKVRIIPSSDLPYGIEEEIIQYTYWADGELTDSTGDPLTDKEIRESCGYEFQDFFGKDPEDPDIVYVKRGDKYYEISMETRRFEDQ